MVHDDIKGLHNVFTSALKDYLRQWGFFLDIVSFGRGGRYRLYLNIDLKAILPAFYEEMERSKCNNVSDADPTVPETRVKQETGSDEYEDEDEDTSGIAVCLTEPPAAVRQSPASPNPQYVDASTQVEEHHDYHDPVAGTATYPAEPLSLVKQSAALVEPPQANDMVESSEEDEGDEGENEEDGSEEDESEEDEHEDNKLSSSNGGFGNKVLIQVETSNTMTYTPTMGNKVDDQWGKDLPPATAVPGAMEMDDFNLAIALTYPRNNISFMEDVKDCAWVDSAYRIMSGDVETYTPNAIVNGRFLSFVSDMPMSSAPPGVPATSDLAYAPAVATTSAHFTSNGPALAPTSYPQPGYLPGIPNSMPDVKPTTGSLLGYGMQPSEVSGSFANLQIASATAAADWRYSIQPLPRCGVC